VCVCCQTVHNRANQYGYAARLINYRKFNFKRTRISQQKSSRRHQHVTAACGATPPEEGPPGLFRDRKMVKTPNAVPGHPSSHYGCTGTAEDAAQQSLHDELASRRYGGRRRAKVVIGSIAGIVCVLAICDLVSNGAENYTFGDFTSLLIEGNTASSAASTISQATPEDIADCSSFQGWLQTDCIQSKVNDRKTVSVWTDDQV
jgi:hypothetical protein